MPVAERAEARRTYWKARWGEVDGACEWPCLDLLESLARQQAQELKPISTAQVVETLRYTANKKGGPDGCTFRFLKLLPREAYSGLVYILHLVEARLRWPEQFLLVQVACLPKNLECERPICLTHVLYRLWCKMRKPLVDHWLMNDKALAFWDQAVKGSTCLQVALLRLCKAEVSKKLGLKQVSLLLDLTCFYDLVDHNLLAEDALSLGFPPIVLFLCLQVHKGPRILQAQDVVSEPIQPRKGILAGCPFGVVFAKIVLWTLMSHVQRVCRPQGLTTWVDDIGVDLRGFNSSQVAKHAVSTFLELRDGLTSRGLKSVSKSLVF